MVDVPIPQVFEVIRKYSKYCSVCGGKLDLVKLEWHLPFCTRCRINVIDAAMKGVSADFEVGMNNKKSKEEMTKEVEVKKDDEGW